MKADPEKDRQIIALDDRGLGTNAIARAVKMRPQNVVRAKRRLGIAPRPTRVPDIAQAPVAERRSA